jgi:predicted nucleic acid-binding protein
VADLGQRLAAHALVGLDTSIWIYHLEANERYLPLTNQILGAIRSGRPAAVLSMITLMELNVRPYRLQQPGVVAHYEAMLTHFPHAQLIDVDRPIARRAAQLRAAYTLRPADALHVATGLVAGATAWVTNDGDLHRLSPLIEVLILDDFLAPKK